MGPNGPERPQFWCVKRTFYDRTGKRCDNGRAVRQKACAMRAPGCCAPQTRMLVKRGFRAGGAVKKL